MGSRRQHIDADRCYGTFRRLNGADLAAYDWTVEGFYIPLKLATGPAEGERILSAGILDAGVLTFTSFQQQTPVPICARRAARHMFTASI